MTSSTHIGFYCSSLSKGGLELNSVRYASYMKEAGYAVTFFCIEHSPLHEACLSAALPVHFIQRNKRYGDVKAAWRIAKISKELKIDWWWFRDPRDMDTLAWAKWLSRGAFKLLYHQAMQLGHPKKDWIHRLRFSAIDQWICLSNQLAQQVQDWTHYPKDRISVLPLALPEDEVAPPYEQGNFKALVVGRWDPQKNQHTVVNAFQLLHKKYPHSTLTFIGESTAGEGQDYEKDIKKKVRHWDLQKFIFFEPFHYNLIPHFLNAHLFIIPSLNETFGMVTIEAMRAGLPIIGSNTGGTKALIEENDCGATFTPLDADALAHQWEKAITDSQWRQEKSKHARNAFNQHFSIQKQMPAWKKIIG